MPCSSCGAHQPGCACRLATTPVPVPAQRAQIAVQAAMESSAELLRFLHEFSLASSPRQDKVAAGQHIGRPDAVTTVTARALWAPPAPSERFQAVPFKPLAIVPLPVAGMTPATGPVGAPEEAPAPVQELLPLGGTAKRRHLRWQRALVGGAVAAACAALAFGILSMVSPGPAQPAHRVINSPANVIVARPQAPRARQ